MSRLPPGPPPASPQAYVGDQIVGGVLLLVNGIQLLMTIGNLAGPTTSEQKAATAQAQNLGLFGAVAILVLSLSVLGLVVDYGIFRSRRWAFFVSLVLSLCATAGLLVGGPKTGVAAWGVLQVLGTLVYAMLRLCRAFGPELR